MTHFDLVGELECVWEVQAICGEGPLWIEADQTFYFVDIDGQKLHCYEEKSNARVHIPDPAIFRCRRAPFVPISLNKSVPPTTP